jgi:hypothetical protein
MATFDDLGAAIERRLDDVEHRLGDSGAGALALGAALAVGVIIGGFAALIIVFVILIRFFS